MIVLTTFVAVFVVPILRVLWLSFQHADLVGHERFVFASFDHYHRLWHDPRWFGALGNTVMFTFSSVAAELLLGPRHPAPRGGA